MSDQREIKRSEIEEKYMVCPYCMEQRDVDTHGGCCGESSCHFVEAYELANDEIVLVEEVIVDEDIAI